MTVAVVVTREGLAVQVAVVAVVLPRWYKYL
jgi:hypothetical protein